MFVNAQDVMKLNASDEAQAGRLEDHCGISINAQRNADPSLKSFDVNTKDFSKTEKDNDDAACTGLTAKVRIEVEARAKAEGWKVAFDEKKRILTFTPKRKYVTKTPVVAVETPETPAENSEAA